LSDSAVKVEHSCPLRRFRKIKVVEPSAGSSRYAATVSVLIAASKVLDHIADKETFIRYLPGVFSRAAGRWIASARKSAGEMGVDTSAIEAQLYRQASLEKEPDNRFLFYSQAIEEASAAACSNTAVVSGRHDNIEPLSVIGRMYGRIIYVLDAYSDYTGDIAAKRFNPLARCFSPDEMRRRAQEIFDEALTVITRQFERLDLVRGEFCTNLFTVALPAAGHSVLFGGGPLPEGAGDLVTEPKKKRRFCSCCGDWCSGCDCCGDSCDCCVSCDSEKSCSVCGSADASSGCCDCGDCCKCDACSCCDCGN
jgi:hypothetical protein